MPIHNNQIAQFQGGKRMPSDVISYTIHGDDMQAVEIELDPGETVIAEAGAMTWMETDIAFEARMGDGSRADEGLWAKIANAGKRLLTRESLFLTHFTNNGNAKKHIAFSAPYPGKIVPMDLAKSGEMLCQKDAFLCAAYGTRLDIAFNKRIGVGFFGGEGFILQKLQGDGLAFIHAGGTVIQRQLNNETLLVDTGSLVAFTSGVDYDIQSAGSLKSMMFGGEGIFLARLSGTGTVYLQTLPFSRLANRIIQSAPNVGGRSRGEGSLIGGISRIFEN